MESCQSCGMPLADAKPGGGGAEAPRGDAGLEDAQVAQALAALLAL
jgi:hypothetical protein